MSDALETDNIEFAKNIKSAKGNSKNINNGTRVTFTSYSQLIYWWPLWVFGYIMAGITYSFGDSYIFNNIIQHGANWYTWLNLLYTSMLLFVIYSTNVRVEGVFALLILLIFVTVVLTLTILFDVTAFAKSIPAFSLFMNTRFFLVFSVGLSTIWLITVLFVDQHRNKWVLEPGLVKEMSFGSTKIDTMEGLKVGVSRNNFPCHYLLGFGLMGDVELKVGPDQRSVTILNVARVGRKRYEAELLIGASQPNG